MEIAKDGKSLVATYTDMPTIVFNAIKNKLYRSRSIEIEDQLRDGKLMNNVLTAVALLGSEIPAVETLGDLGKFLMSKDENLDSYKIDYERDTSITKSNQLCFSMNIKKEASIMTDEEIKAMQAELAASNLKNAKLETENVTLNGSVKEFTKSNEDREALAKVAKVTDSRKVVTEFFEAAVKDEHITVAQRETFSKLLGVEDDEKVISIDIKDVENDSRHIGICCHQRLTIFRNFKRVDPT